MRFVKIALVLCLLGIIIATGCRKSSDAADAGKNPAAQQKNEVDSCLAQLNDAIRLDNKEAALSWCQRLEPIVPANNDEALLQMGRGYLLAGQTDKARQKLQQARALQAKQFGAGSAQVSQTDRYITQCNTQSGQENSIKKITVTPGGEYDLVTSSMSEPEKIEFYLKALQAALDKKDLEKAGKLAPRLKALAAKAPQAAAPLAGYYMAAKNYQEADPFVKQQLFQHIEQYGKFDRNLLPLLQNVRLVFQNTNLKDATLMLTQWEMAINLEIKPPQPGTPDAERLNLLLTNAQNALQKMNTRRTMEWCWQAELVSNRQPQDSLRLAKIYDLVGLDTKAIGHYSDYINQNPGATSAEMEQALTSLKLLLISTNRLPDALPVMMKWVACKEAIHGKDHAYTAMAREELEAMRQKLQSLPPAPATATQPGGAAVGNAPPLPSLTAEGINQYFDTINQALKNNNPGGVLQIGAEVEPYIRQDPAKLYQLGLAYSRAKAPDRAIAILSAAVQEYNRQKGSDNYPASNPLKRLVELYSGQQQYAAASNCLEQLVELNEKKWGKDDSRTAALRKQADEMRTRIGDSQLATSQPPAIPQPARPTMLPPVPTPDEAMRQMGPGAFQRSARDPREAVQVFLRAKIEPQPFVILDVTLPNCNSFLLWTDSEALSPDIKAEALKLIDQVQVVPCKPGESLLLPNGQKLAIDATMVLDGRRPVLAMLPGGSEPMVLWVHKIEPDRWVIDTGPIINQRKAALAQLP